MAFEQNQSPMTHIPAPNPLYRFVEHQTGEPLMTANEIFGFFVDPQCDESGQITLAGVPQYLNIPEGETDDVRLDIIDARGEAIGHYYIGQAFFGAATPSMHGEGVVDVSSSFYGECIPYPKAAAIWHRWASATPVERGEWRRYPVSWHDSWLHITQQAWFSAGRRATIYGEAESISIDGADIGDKSGFYCAIGEAINGPGGYMGATLDGLLDCLSFHPMRHISLRLTWNNYPASSKILGADFTNAVVNILREFEVTVFLR